MACCMVTRRLCIPAAGNHLTTKCDNESVMLRFRRVYTSISNDFLLNVGRLKAFIISGSGDAAFITPDTAEAPAGSDLTGINGSDQQPIHPY